MKSFFVKIPGPPLIIVIILLTAATLLACGPAAQSAPGEQPGSQPAQEKSTPEPTNTPTPTPLPTDVVTKTEGGGWKEIISTTGGSVPNPTPKYTAIIDTGLHDDVTRLEATKEAQDQAEGGASGASGPRQAVDDPVVFVKVYLTANTLTVADWLRNNGVNPANVREFEDGSGGRFSASVPLSLLGELATQEGIEEIQRPGPISVDKE